MLDILGGLALVAGVIFTWSMLIRAGTPLPAMRRKIATRVALWFAAVTLLGALGVFAAQRFGTPIMGLAVVLPVIVGVVIARRSHAIHPRRR